MTRAGAAAGPARSAASALLPGARCAKHEARPATGVCARCGDYLCGACGLRVDDRLCCSPCAARITREHSRRSELAFVFALLSVHGLFPLAPVALALALAELAAIRAGHAPVGGRTLARAGLAFSLCSLAMAISGVLAIWFAVT
jgi:hypothetical protein